MNYAETIAFLYSRLPVFHRVGKAAYKEGLDNTLRLDAYFGHPHRKFRTIHVAGTNGKGSVSHMLAAIFQTAGYQTGLYTSPHLKDFRERIRIQGQMIPEQEVIRFVHEHQEMIRVTSPSFFELTVAMAFDFFARSGVEIAVIEVGLGGRLDSTNIITPELSVITNISWDHTDLLGDTLEKIAAEKAGIIKPGIPVVIGETRPETRPVFETRAQFLNSPLLFAEDHFTAEDLGISNNGLRSFRLKNRSGETFFPEIDLLGFYQRKNIKTLYGAVEMLNRQGFHLDQEVLLPALKNVCALTGLLGRWQILSRNPLIICDTGHNEAGIKEVMAQLEELQYANLHIIFGSVNDKPLERVLSLLPKRARYYFTRAEIPRALDPSILQAKAEEYQIEGLVFNTVKEAFARALVNAGPQDIIFIGGSTFVVADFLSQSDSIN